MGFFRFFYPWGIILQLIAVRALHPPSSRQQLAVCHLLPRAARRPRLHRRGGAAGPVAAAAVVRLVRPQEEDPPPRSAGARQSVAGQLRGARRVLSRREEVREGARELRQGAGPARRSSWTRTIAGRSRRFSSETRRPRGRISSTSIAREAKYDSHRAMALLAHACAQTGDAAQADALFARATESSTLPETHYNYASFLASQGRADEARAWAQRHHRASATACPFTFADANGPWFRKAKALLKRLPKPAAS